MWNELMASMSLVRKVLRFFKTLVVLRQLRAAIPSDPAKLDLALFLNLCAKFALANYFFWDHFSQSPRASAWTGTGRIRGCGALRVAAVETAFDSMLLIRVTHVVDSRARVYFLLSLYQCLPTRSARESLIRRAWSRWAC